MVRHGSSVARFAPAALLAVAAGVVVAAADLEPRADRAWSEYVARAEQAFVAARRAHVDEAAAAITMVRQPGQPVIGPANGDGILKVPGGLVHHWKGQVFIPGATLSTALDVSRAYPAYPEMYRSIVSATILEQHDNVYLVVMRLREQTSGVSAVLDIRSRIEYHYWTRITRTIFRTPRRSGRSRTLAKATSGASRPVTTADISGAPRRSRAWPKSPAAFTWRWKRWVSAAGSRRCSAG